VSYWKDVVISKDRPSENNYYRAISTGRDQKNKKFLSEGRVIESLKIYIRSCCSAKFRPFRHLQRIQGLDLVLWTGGMGVDLSHFPGYLWFFTEIKTSSRHLSARPKVVDLAVLVDIPGHFSHFI
jgi:hypothetical protein